MRNFKHQMGVEGPSFYREQQERLRREQQGRDQPPAEAPKPPGQASMFDVFRPRSEERAAGPAPAKAEPPPSSGFQRQGPSAVDANKYFKVPEMWEYINRARDMGNQIFIVDTFTNRAADLNQAAVEIAQYFRIPPSFFEGLTLDEAWKRVIGPFLGNLEESMMRMRPFMVPGSLRFELSDEPENQLILVYQDR